MHMTGHWSKYGRKIQRCIDVMSSELYCSAMVPFFLWRTVYTKFSNQRDIISHKVIMQWQSVFSSSIFNNFSSNLECKILKNMQLLKMVRTPFELKYSNRAVRSRLSYRAVGSRLSNRAVGSRYYYYTSNYIRNNAVMHHTWEEYDGWWPFLGFSTKTVLTLLPKAETIIDPPLQCTWHASVIIPSYMGGNQ